MKITKWHVITAGIVAAVSGASVAIGVKKKAQVELASTPKDLSWKSWKQALIETKDALNDKNLSMYAAGIAYFGVLAFFPLVAAIVAIAGLAIEPRQLSDAAASLSTYLPKDIASMFTAQLKAATGQNASSLLVAIVGIVLSIWAVSGAVQNVMKSLNVTYDVEETRGFIKQKVVSLGLTIGAILGGLVAAAVFVSGNDVLKDIGFPSLFVDTFAILRWIIVVIIAMIAFAVLYRYGPDKKPSQQWQWVSWGAIIATTIWMIGSAIFFIYMQNFANFSESYSTFAGIIGLMMWLNISALVVLLGAEINHRLEERTVLSTTK